MTGVVVYRVAWKRGLASGVQRRDLSREAAVRECLQMQERWSGMTCEVVQYVRWPLARAILDLMQAAEEVP